MKEKKETFNFKKFLKDNIDNWIYLEHYNDTLKLHNEGILFIKSFNCLNDRLANVTGTYIQQIEFEDGTRKILTNEQESTFVLSKIDIGGFSKTIVLENLAKEIINRLLLNDESNCIS